MDKMAVIVLSTILILSLQHLTTATDFCIPSCHLQGPNTPILEGTLVPDPTSNYHYYMCSDPANNGIDFELSEERLKCDDGMYFYQYIDSTGDYGSYPRCLDTPHDGPDEDYCNACNPCLVDCSGNEGELVPDPLDCAGFYHCDPLYATPPHFTCADDEVFDYPSQACGPKGNTTKCFDSCDPCQVYCNKEGRMPNPTDCRGYLYCRFNEGVVHFHCKAGQFFNQFTLACEDDGGQTCEPMCDSIGANESATSTDLNKPVVAVSLEKDVEDRVIHADPANLMKNPKDRA